MYARKPIALFTAMLITAAGIAGIASYSNLAVNGAQHSINATADAITTLPTINVSPSKEQLRELHKDQAGVAPANIRMPYYSFASDSAGA
ncbi:MAG TPA: hypothetical protein VF284_12220 [Rhodanobacteraceae bacterium]